jgi:hypothetical protein
MKNNQNSRNSSNSRNRSKTATVTTPAKSVENGIKIIRNALKKKISVSAASRENGRGKNYVSAIKIKLDSNLQTKAITKDLHREFNSLYSQYAKLT